MNQDNVLAECTQNMRWGTGLSKWVTENTKGNFWPGDNLVGKMLMDITEEQLLTFQQNTYMDLPISGDEDDFEDADDEREMQTDESAQQRKQQEEQVKEQGEQDQEQAGSKKHESNLHSSSLENTMTQAQTQTGTQTDNANQVKQATQKEGSRHKPQSNIASKSEDKTKDKLLSRRTSVKTYSFFLKLFFKLL